MKFNMNCKKSELRMMFLENALKNGIVEWNGVKLALLHEPFRDFDVLNEWCFRSEAMDIHGNIWWIRWDCNVTYRKPDDWEKPSYAELTDEYYF